jgi:hypothetical protein
MRRVKEVQTVTGLDIDMLGGKLAQARHLLTGNSKARLADNRNSATGDAGDMSAIGVSGKIRGITT